MKIDYDSNDPKNWNPKMILKLHDYLLSNRCKNHFLTISGLEGKHKFKSLIKSYASKAKKT